MGNRVFVTGATGQIGGPLVRALVARGDDVIGLARGQVQTDSLAGAGASVVRGDIEATDALTSGLSGANIIFHLAGGLRGPGTMTADRLNRGGTENLIAAIRKVGGRAPVVVYASSCAVYGDRSGLWVPEDYPPAPATAYGHAKVAAEAALLGSGIPSRIARIAAVYGPGCRFTMAQPIAAGRAWLPGEGKNYVPIIHIDDAVEALLAISDRGADGEIYNVAAPTCPLFRAFYTAVHQRVGGKPVRFWSTWIPSAIQFRAAAINERVATRLNQKPRFTADALRLATASVRLKTARLERELGFVWRYADFERGLDAFLSPA